MTEKSWLGRIRQSFQALSNPEVAFQSKIEEFDRFMEGWNNHFESRLGNYNECEHQTNNTGPKVDHRNFFQFASSEQDTTPNGSHRYKTDINSATLERLKSTDGYKALQEKCAAKNIDLEIKVHRQEVGSHATDPATFRVDHHMALEFKTNNGKSFRDNIQSNGHAPSKMGQNL